MHETTDRRVPSAALRRTASAVAAGPRSDPPDVGGAVSRGDGGDPDRSRDRPPSRRRSSSALLSSLLAFAAAGVRPRTPLARAIAVALAIKFCVVVAARIFLFGADDRPVVTEETVTRLFSPPAASRLP